MRNFSETDTHIQCCAKYCKKMLRKTKRMQKSIEKTGFVYAKMCTKHTRESAERVGLESMRVSN